MSRQRAERVLAALRAQGIGSAHVATVGIGSEKPLREERTEEDKQYNRSVSFRVVPAAQAGAPPLWPTPRGPGPALLENGASKV